MAFTFQQLPSAHCTYTLSWLWSVFLKIENKHCTARWALGFSKRQQTQHFIWEMGKDNHKIFVLRLTVQITNQIDDCRSVLLGLEQNFAGVLRVCSIWQTSDVFSCIVFGVPRSSIFCKHSQEVEISTCMLAKVSQNYELWTCHGIDLITPFVAVISVLGINLLWTWTHIVLNFDSSGQIIKIEMKWFKWFTIFS